MDSPLGGLVDDAVDVLEEGLVHAPRIAVDKGDLAVRIRAVAVVPDGDAALDDREALGLAVVEVKVDVGGRGVVEDAPGGVAKPEEGLAVSRFKVAAVGRDANRGERLR